MSRESDYIAAKRGHGAESGVWQEKGSPEQQWESSVLDFGGSVLKALFTRSLQGSSAHTTRDSGIAQAVREGQVEVSTWNAVRILVWKGAAG